ncbi:MAG TPA: PSD1 and planctomycete cytochrome C domain-containing protein [Planctomycetota bacterium]|nr:PSD1 and planctomycete cytochrome C domain-containing protein [Planctomycetota bacterium]
MSFARCLTASALVFAHFGHALSQDAPPDVDFSTRIAPLLSQNCWKCHGPDHQKGGLRLDGRSAALRGGDSTDHVLVPGKSAKSDLIARVRSSDPDVRMPPKGNRLPPDQIELLAAWIDAGALWPEAAAPLSPVTPGRAITPEQRAYWAFQPVRNPAVPPVKHAGLICSPVDAFILARLEREGLEPAPEASRLDLIRRVTYDLTGLPPTPQELDAFVQDPAYDAYERLVDRLLDSPRYGERWAQHWLDVVRFGESEGFEYDTPVGNLWRYRDYVIHSLNADKPYDRFVREQVAGDELDPSSREALIAAGFHRLGPVRRNAGNQEVASSRNEVLTDRTDIIGAAFLGVTLGCARCHDHKFDPILQKDYYRLQAFLAATEEHNISLATLEEDAAYKAETRHLQEQIVPLKKRLKTAQGEERILLEQEIEQLEDQKPPAPPAINTVRDLPEPTKIHVLRRGEWDKKGDPVGMRFPTVLISDNVQELPLTTPNPRVELARWLTDPAHPLTPRVLVNRVWSHHFGTGLVKTANDFGMNGEKPSNPDLLDFLATAFMQNGWRLKPLHRLILLSRTYRQAYSTPETAGALAKDPDNRWLWRFDRRRLSAEELRDSMLSVSGTLNPAMGGPSVFVPVDPELVSALYKPAQWAVTHDQNQHHRRSIYLVAKRNLRLPPMEVFDQPTLNSSCGRRECSTHAPQALELLNGSLSNPLAVAFAERLRREAAAGLQAQVDLAFRLAAGRPPSADEARLALGFLAHHPLKEFALALFNLNAFLYVN